MTMSTDHTPPQTPLVLRHASTDGFSRAATVRERTIGDNRGARDRSLTGASLSAGAALFSHTHQMTRDGALGCGAVCVRVDRSRRRGSVLVLVMTLLSILFVLGVAFLTSMNFEAEMIAAQVARSQKTAGVDAVAEGLHSKLRDGLLGGPASGLE